MNDEECWKVITNGIVDKYIIYPYKNGKIIEEEIFKQTNPITYKYLLEHKHELEQRDKGKKTYPVWYSYGRSQSIHYMKKPCIYVRCFIDSSKIENYLTIKDNTLHYGCLCICPNNNVDIDDIVNIIKKNSSFIGDNSSKRSGGWITISSRILNEIPLD
jgi:hypothetical protein